MYGILDVKNENLSERDLDEFKLRSLAVALNKTDERSSEAEVETMTSDQWKEQGPLGERRTAQEKRRTQ